MICPNCGQRSRVDREFCALCGAKMKKRRSAAPALLLILLVLTLAGLAVWWLLGRSAQEPAEKSVPAEPAESPGETLNSAQPSLPWTDVVQVRALDTCTLALCGDGTLRMAGVSPSAEMGFDLEGWSGVTALEPLPLGVAALTADGRVRLTGEVLGFESAAQWREISFLCYSAGTLYGVTAEGRLLYAGATPGADPSALEDIVNLLPGESDTLALSFDGRVSVLPSRGLLGDAEGQYGIVSVAACGDRALYLMEDGTVRPAAVSEDWLRETGLGAEIADWVEIRQLYLGETYVLGLSRSGRVLAAGTLPPGLEAVADWEQVERLLVNGPCAAALTRDGRVLSAWTPEAPAALDTADWTEITDISLSKGHLAGLRSDGRVLTTGDDRLGQCGGGA